MSKRRYFSVLRNSDHHRYSPVLNLVAAVVLIGGGAAIYLAWPDDAATQPQIAAASTPATAAASTPATTAAADESLCDKQAWPYVDQRCAQRVDAARGTRQVRIVTDKGHSVTAVTPVPIVEPKQQKPAPQTPAVAQNDKPLGPPVAPVAAGPAPQTETVAAAPQPAPQNPAPKTATAPAPTVQVTVAPANRPASTVTVPREASNPPADTRTASVEPAAASSEPAAAGSDAFAEAPEKKSKSARAERAEKRAAEKAERAAKREAEKTAKREAKRRSPVEESNSGGVPEDVASAVKSVPANEQNSRSQPASSQNSRRAAKAVPDEVLEAVQQATGDSGRRGSRRMVIIEGGGERGFQANGW